MLEPKMKKFIIVFDSGWVLKHRNDDVLPVAALKTELEKDKTLKIEDYSLTSLTVVYSEQTADYRGLKGFVTRFFNARYPEENFKDAVTLQSGTVDGEEQPKETNNEGEDDLSDIRELLERRRRELIERMNRLSEEEEEDEDDEDEDDGEDESEDSGEPPAKEKSVIEKIDGLVGAAEFKKLAKEICGVADEIRRTKTYEVFTNQCYLFSIGDGCGLSTYLELLSGLISENKLCNMSETVEEEKIEAYRESMEPFSSVMRALWHGNDRSCQLLCVDISEWMDKTDNRYFKQFLREVEKRSKQFIVVFRTPFVDKDILARIKYSLSDLLSVKSVSFPPLSREEIKTYAAEELNNYKFTITDTAWKYFFDRISEEKSDGKFYGINTVKKVVRELIYQKHVANSKREDKSSQITAGDAKALCGEAANSNMSGTEQLNKLVGMDGIKKRIEEIIAQIELSMESGSDQRPCIHMSFVGNPGTGKTTVARILGKILKEKGVLRVGAFFEYAGRDFCGRYIGETAPKTASICRDAYGSVLFIDEAYSLYRGDGDTKDFGREAIDTLIAEMENHRSDFIVIMAGYNDDMEKLKGGNLGLASRMPYTVEFPNFSREQLYEIFVSMVKERFKYDGSVFEAARKFFIGLPEEVISAKEFANARYVRNLFERTWAKAAMRCQLGGKKDIVLTGEDFERACSDKEFGNDMNKKTKIGFNN